MGRSRKCRLSLLLSGNIVVSLGRHECPRTVDLLLRDIPSGFPDALFHQLLTQDDML